MTVRQLLQSVDSRELSEWMAYFKLENERMEESRNPSLSEKIKRQFKEAGY